MTSFDSNLALYAWNADSPFHQAALRFVNELSARDDVAVSEFMLTELYVLLRNPAVVKEPLTAAEAVEQVQIYRRHPRWAVLGFPEDSLRLHSALWQHAAGASFARRRIYDARFILSLQQQGVTKFATVNVKDFLGFSLARVWNPLVRA